tara:strand:- start:457 stop:852 length:396 start_codon:yes stop_codon:yes gene_type:complete
MDNNGKIGFSIDVNSDISYEDFMDMMNEKMIKPLMERRAKHLDKMNELLNLIDEGEDIKIKNWLIKNNKELYINDFMVSVKDDLVKYQNKIDELINSSFMKEIDKMDIIEEKNLTWEEKINEIEEKIKSNI